MTNIILQGSLERLGQENRAGRRGASKRSRFAVWKPSLNVNAL